MHQRLHVVDNSYSTSLHIVLMGNTLVLAYGGFVVAPIYVPKEANVTYGNEVISLLGCLRFINASTLEPISLAVFLGLPHFLK